MAQIGKILLIAGAVLAVVGVLFMVGDKLGLGRLPGDIVWRRKNVTIHIPVVTSLIVSLLLTLLVNFFLRRK